MTQSHELQLAGIDGANPLGFLAALGTHRAADLALPELGLRMGWTRSGGAWRPRLTSGSPIDRTQLLDRLHVWLSARGDHPEFDLGANEKNINVAPEVFRRFAQKAVLNAAPADRATADFAAAFGSDGIADSRGRIENTALRTMSGSGWQNFLEFMRNIINATTPAHLDKALFSPWAYDDPVEKLTMRWDPLDDTRYALRWRNPSGDPERGRRGSVLGANRLAIEALPLIPTAPVQRGLATLGFRRPRRGEPVWRWPIWEPPISVNVLRSLLSRPELHGAPSPAAALRELGVTAVFESTRVRPSDYYRNFAPGVPV